MEATKSFKWRHFQGEIILLCVRWYLRYGLSYRDLEEMMAERGLKVNHSTISRWVQAYAPDLEKRVKPQLKPTNDSWGATRRTSRSKANSCISIGQWVVKAIRWTSGSAPSVTPRPPKPCSRKRWARRTRSSRASSTSIRTLPSRKPWRP
jgi:transposase-like protein